jgi:hypothetical protein
MAEQSDLKAFRLLGHQIEVDLAVELFDEIWKRVARPQVPTARTARLAPPLLANAAGSAAVARLPLGF